MLDIKTQILAVVVFTSCVVVIWRSKNNSIEKTRYCLNDTTPNGKPFNKSLKVPVIDVNEFTSKSPVIFKNASEISKFYSKKRDRRGKSIPFNQKKFGQDTKKDLIIRIASGLIEGKVLKVFGSTVYAFLGIPYAEPPIGDLRFAKPVPIKGWIGIKQTKNFSLMCPHKALPKSVVPMKYITEEISEDCLTLNVWTPDLRPKALKTVMVWIHGGAFQYSSANLFETDGKVLASFGDVVVVSINYRNGVLGFLNAQTASAPGNMGIYDQALGLNWVKDNIQQFGGDPNKIVPFGESAGAISIGILMAMDSVKNLFSRAITASGGALLPGILTSKTVQNGEKFAKLVGCAANKEYKTNPEKVVHCLKKVPLDQLLDAQTQILNNSQVAFVPAPNGAFKDVKAPGDLLEDPTLFSNMKELLAGVVPNEGAWLMHSSASDVFKRHTFPHMRTLEDAKKLFNWYLIEKVGIAANVAPLIANSMIVGEDIDTPLNHIQRVSQAMGDNSITCPTIFMADELTARNKTVFMYLFDHKAKPTKFGEWQGVSHYEEVPFVFGYPLRRTKLYDEQDIELSKRMMKIWSHFAKTGKVLSQFGVKWPRYDDGESYMVLKPNKSLITKSFHERNCEIFKASFKLFNAL